MIVSESLDSVSELPTSVSHQLHHLSKGRPKRSKTRATSRLHIRSQEEQDDISLMDAFFRAGSATSSSATPLVSPSSDERCVYLCLVYVCMFIIVLIEFKMSMYIERTQNILEHI